MAKTATIAFLTVTAFSVGARAEDFRVETTVKVGKQQYMFLTLFRGTKAYDFQLPKSEISIFDMRSKQVILVDPKRSLRTIVTFADLEKFSIALRMRAKERKEDGFFGDIKYQFNKDARLPHQAATNVLAYAARSVTPPDPEDASRYRKFTDAAARLAAFKPGGLPPFVRLQLNEEIEKIGQVPVEVRRTIHRLNLAKNGRDEVTATHDYNWLLAENDQTRIAQANKWLAQFKTVTLEVYLQIAPRVANAPGKPPLK
ncbi:MAG TPA: hypothetical protein EYG57_04360 [Planctomycetes bacterium]|nr:hypothetical protein [Planctomycetota bacterium]